MPIQHLQLECVSSENQKMFHNNFGTTTRVGAKPDQNSCRLFKPFIDPTHVTVQTSLSRNVPTFARGYKKIHWGAVKTHLVPRVSHEQL